ncbi:modification methylase HemK [Thiobacillus denitrificans ATCC 25259]|uniref:Release factor glutamine methyltransferase n=1 Tax=Thiobacillus denitrificans (strain ATCC 25259 / T1) TaxID=292415 RepID=Q3SG09_THIDA|nr:peptide chain release factor N(5)-glutamine methyltransferase [Thiobacillus denitrificans]AAZ98447.1 modification methylase HemK [Thiobacillus denitrificans ATCC 25259]
MTGHAATVAGLLDVATDRVGRALGLDKREARLEARVLAAHAWQVTPAWLIAHDTDVATAPQTAAFDALLARRLGGEPIAYIVGAREFYGRRFEVSPAVLIPRPETELLVELALARIPPDETTTVLDLGTGSGCIAITLALERSRARVTAVERSPAALALARRNAQTLGASVEFSAGDWFSDLTGRSYDLIVANPPYIADADPHLARGDLRHEPVAALASGADGLDELRRLIDGARDHLRRPGMLLLEHGYDQADAVHALLRSGGFARPRCWHDLAGNPRVSGAELSK